MNNYDYIDIADDDDGGKCASFNFTRNFNTYNTRTAMNAQPLGIIYIEMLVSRWRVYYALAIVLLEDITQYVYTQMYVCMLEMRMFC